MGNYAPDMESALQVSVIIPVWNTGAYLDESVQSALRELVGIDGEIILIDDHSDDMSTLKALERCKSLSPIISVLLNQSGVKGAGAARNFGIQHARGEWLLFLDSDDVFIDGCIAKRLAVAEEHPNLQWMSADFYKWYPPAEPEGNGYFADRLESYHSVKNAFEADSVLIRQSPVDDLFDDFMPVNTLVVMIRRKLCIRVGGFSTGLQKAEDTYLWLKLAFLEVPFAFLPYPVGKYRIRNDSLTHEDRPSGMWRILLYKEFYQDPEFSDYRKKLSQKISNGYLSDSNYYRRKKRPLTVVGNAMLSIRWNIKNIAAWKNMLVGLALASKLKRTS